MAYASDECRLCDDWDDGEGCIEGRWYGHCMDDFCHGMCEYLGDCDCSNCHGLIEIGVLNG
jgi:hypothetical protein